MLLLAAALAAAGLVTGAGATGAYAAPAAAQVAAVRGTTALPPYQAGYLAIVGQTTSCGDNWDQPCPYTEVHLRAPGDWDEPGYSADVAWTITDLADGAKVPHGTAILTDGVSFLDPDYGDTYVAGSTNTLLPAGAYQIAATVTHRGHWSCSEYNPEGCSWISTTKWSGLWRFRYDGTTKVAQPEYRAPRTWLRSVSAKRAGRYLSVAGKVTAATVDPATFRLRSERPVPGARVAVLTRVNGAWKVRRTLTAHSDGTWHTRFAAPAKTPVRVQVAGTATYPAKHLTTSRR